MRWRYRPVQAVVIALLAALVVGCAAFAPIYDRAIRQAVAATTLDATEPAVAGLQLTGRPSDSGGFGRNSQAAPVPPEEVADLVPRGARGSYAAPILGYAATAGVIPSGVTKPSGELVWRGGECDHLTLASGTCPTDAGEIAVSRADRRVFGYAPGTTLRIAAVPSGGIRPHERSVEVTVSGVYDQTPGDYWFGTDLTGRAGIVDPGPPAHVQHDVWLTARATFEDPVPPLPGRSSTADFALDRSVVGVDEVLSLDSAIASMKETGAVGGAGGLVDVYSGMPDIADEVRAQVEQSRVTVPLLMLQLGVLALVVLWLVLAAVTEQRRPEVALARLRGRGRRGALGLLLGELLPVVVVGVVPGVLLALLGSYVVRSAVLPGEVPFEAGRPVVAATGVAAAALVVVTVLAAVRIAREPVVTLLRRVPPRRTGWALGAADAVLIAGAGAIALLFVVGGLRGPAALAAPGLLAVVVGLLLAHLMTPVAAAAGRRSLRRGQVRIGMALLDAARSPATRRVVVMVTLATALAVFSADAQRVGDRNWTSAAEQEAGAPMVATVGGTDLAGLRAALAELPESDRRHVTPVVRMRPPGEGVRTTLAVVPDEFRRIAVFPGGEPPASVWEALAPDDAEPIRLRGTTLSAEVTDSTLVSQRIDGGSNPVRIGVDVLTAAGEVVQVGLGELAGHVDRVRLTASIACRTGCYLTAVWVGTLPGATIEGHATLGDLSAAGPVPVGPASRWVPTDDPRSGRIEPVSDRADRLTVQVHGSGSALVSLRQAWLPATVPALLSGDLPTTTDDRFDLTALDGQAQPGIAVGRLERVPGSGPDNQVVNLDVVERGRTVDPTATLQVWFDGDDPALLRSVGDVLERHSLSIASTSTLQAARAHLGSSAAAWSLQLATFVGGAALAIALLVLVVGAVSTWRSRTRDLAALRMSGVPHRQVRWMAVAAQLPAVVTGVVAGALTGLYGAHLALPIVPLFAVEPVVSTLDLATAWWAAAAAALLALLVLGLGGALIGRRLAARADLTRLRESL